MDYNKVVAKLYSVIDDEQQIEVTLDEDANPLIRLTVGGLVLLMTCTMDELVTLAKRDPGMLGTLAKRAAAELVIRIIERLRHERLYEHTKVKDRASWFAQIVHPWVKRQRRLPEAEQSQVFHELLKSHDTALTTLPEITAWAVELAISEEIWTMVGLRPPMDNPEKFVREYIYKRSNERDRLDKLLEFVTGIPSCDEIARRVSTIVAEGILENVFNHPHRPAL